MGDGSAGGDDPVAVRVADAARDLAAAWAGTPLEAIRPA